ncbi:MAG TPA: hypothetical protein VEU08_07085 [Vicinamibacterales bacterium]|nr:hypothetical protein [Vicinamibacterales bacterium]
MKAFFAAILLASTAAAQDRIVLPRGPEPDQTVRTRMTQEMTVTVEPADAPGGPGDTAAAPPASAAIGTITLAMKMTLAQTLKIGARDDRQRFEAVATIDDMSVDGTMNGMPLPAMGAAPLRAGQQFTIQYDENRAITSVTGDASGPAADMIKQVLQAASRMMPSGPIGVGDTVSVPLSLPLPSLPTGPIGGVSGDASMTLKAISSEGGSRLASFDTKFSAALAPPAQGGAAPIAFRMTVSGTGATVIDVDRGIARSAEQQGTIEGTVAGGVLPSMKVHGTLRQSTQLVQ